MNKRAKTLDEVLEREFEKRKVCILWRGSDTALLDTLVYKPEGLIRTYWPDRIDWRVGETVSVEDREGLFAALAEGHHVAVPVDVARKVLAPGARFA